MKKSGTMNYSYMVDRFLRIKLFWSILFLTTAVSSLAQSSNVVLSALKVMDVVDPSVNELNTFLIDLTVSDPKALTRLEIVLEDNVNPENTLNIVYPITAKDGKVQVDLDKYSVPFEGTNIQLFLKVKNQFKEPYHRITVRGYDNGNAASNQLVYTRLK